MAAAAEANVSNECVVWYQPSVPKPASPSQQQLMKQNKEKGFLWSIMRYEIRCKRVKRFLIAALSLCPTSHTRPVDVVGPGLSNAKRLSTGMAYANDAPAYTQRKLSRPICSMSFFLASAST